MAFKIKKILTDRQLVKAKFSVTMGCICLLITMTTSQYVQSATQTLEAKEGGYDWLGDTFVTQDTVRYDRGEIVYYSKNTEICNSAVLIPGIALLPGPFLAVFYALALVYLFLGIGIVSDVFMAGIERITSTTQVIKVKDAQGEVVRSRRVTVWNPTVANLTLMALGSSAPEILLAVLETSMNLGLCPGELGPSTIVGSAAFNLLIISAVSIYAVNEANDTDEDRDTSVAVGIKKIYDMGVFTCTVIFSLWAYIWMFLVLMDQKVEAWEAWLTLAFFFLLIGSAYAMDRYKAHQVAQEDISLLPEEAPFSEWSALEIYKELIEEKQGNSPSSEEQKEKILKMKSFLKASMNTDQIEKVQLDDLKKAIDGDNMMTRIKYRRQVTNFIAGKQRAPIAKGEIIKEEHVQASHIDENEKNDDFGFSCLHYSVSEASGSIRINILNKKGTPGRVHVTTIDAEAKAGDDYEKVDETIVFKQGQATAFIEVTINDDDNWEPDEDFFVQLYNPDSMQELLGKDTRTRVTIIDDDKPGQISFEETKGIKVLASGGQDTVCEIVLLRKNGSDGKVTVDYKTIELDQSDHTATAGIDYKHVEGMVVFEQNQTTATIEVPILAREDVQERDDSFGIQLFNIVPDGAKLSKKSFQIVNIITDVEGKKRAEALQQLMSKIEAEEEASWGQQFVQACMLHPTKNEEGEIEDISGSDAFLHFACIGWKIFFSCIPPAHYKGGLPCFVISLAFIGMVTYVVGEFANLFGCVLGILPSVTAITFVALGTSLPDTFASMAAAAAEKYADSAVGNVTGSNSVNVFLGLGLPWVIASLWEEGQVGNPNAPYPADGKYFVPAGNLGFSVAVFICCAILCIIVLVIRRRVVGGELGGGQFGRSVSALTLGSLWCIYITLSVLQAYDIIDKESVSMGVDLGARHQACHCRPEPERPACYKLPEQIAYAIKAGHKTR